ncbi:MAG: hypothetical protein L0Z50_08685 [Verrucomicrobiales bacterium]|nr:hypothetical protein [Verrucomicrobiales bacterium]
MKKLMMLGGLTGFAIGLGFGLAHGNSWPLILWRASVATFCIGWLGRWLGGIWIRSLHEGKAGYPTPDAILQPVDPLKK